jgi:alpha-tubulin suppressor-like RCC1 family protein
VSSAGYHTVLLGDDGVVYGCGANSDAELALGAVERVWSLQPLPLPQEVGEKNGWESAVVSVAASYNGASATFVLLRDGRVFGTGSIVDFGEAGEVVYTTTATFRLLSAECAESVRHLFPPSIDE